MPKVKLTHAFCLTAACEPDKLKTVYWNVGDPQLMADRPLANDAAPAISAKAFGRTSSLRTIPPLQKVRFFTQCGHAQWASSC